MRNILKCTCTDSMGGYGPFILRVVTGVIFAAHGYMKLVGGAAGVAGFLTMLGFPAPLLFAWLLILGELIGGILLILGLYTHWAAKLTAFIAVVAFLTVHITRGFLVTGGGYEYIVLLIAASVCLIFTGPGVWSLDHRMRG